MPKPLKIEVGDRITFRACTRWSNEKATRMVNGFTGDRPTVRYSGCGNFIVRRREILAHTPKEA